MRIAFAPLLILALSEFSGTARAQITDEDCGPLSNAFGPFDYRKADAGLRRTVEDYHFTPKVERLLGGQSGTVDGDLSYTLRVFPNHSRALVAMVNLSLREKKRKLNNSPYSIDCWFDRAMRFQPDDGQVRAVYAYYLSRLSKFRQAADFYLEAIRLGSDTANVHYNLGLALFELKDYEGSLIHAKQAYELGFTLPGLRRKLEDAGAWKD